MHRKGKPVPQYDTLWRIWPLLFWKKCFACGGEFRWEWGWHGLIGPYMNGVGRRVYLCKRCGPSRQDAEKYFMRPLTPRPTPPRPEPPPDPPCCPSPPCPRDRWN